MSRPEKCAECGRKDGVREFRIFTGHIIVEGGPHYMQKVHLCEDHYPE